MPDWLTPEVHALRNITGPVPQSPDGPVFPEPATIALDALGGPSETMQAAGLTNRGSLAYAMKERGFPQPVKTLRGIRLWDLDAVKNWKAQN